MSILEVNFVKKRRERRWYLQGNARSRKDLMICLCILQRKRKKIKMENFFSGQVEMGVEGLC